MHLISSLEHVQCVITNILDLMVMVVKVGRTYDLNQFLYVVMWYCVLCNSLNYL